MLAGFRIAPKLFEPHGVSAGDATEALIAGLQRVTASTGTPCGVIVCGMRHDPEHLVALRADTAVRFHVLAAHHPFLPETVRAGVHDALVAWAVAHDVPADPAS